MRNSVTIGTVCFLIDEKENTVLLLERANEPMKGMFTGVGGKTDFGEDIYKSCQREIKEETGFDAENLRLKGIIKTLLDGTDSSWILFVYTTVDFSGQQIDCNEGELKWTKTEDFFKINLIGFIKEILFDVLNSDKIIEGTIKHDSRGNVLETNFKHSKMLT